MGLKTQYLLIKSRCDEPSVVIISSGFGLRKGLFFAVGEVRLGALGGRMGLPLRMLEIMKLYFFFRWRKRLDRIDL
jgi:hypothetical protein